MGNKVLTKNPTPQDVEFVYLSFYHQKTISKHYQRTVIEAPNNNPSLPETSHAGSFPISTLRKLPNDIIHVICLSFSPVDLFRFCLVSKEWFSTFQLEFRTWCFNICPCLAQVDGQETEWCALFWDIMKKIAFFNINYNEHPWEALVCLLELRSGGNKGDLLTSSEILKFLYSFPPCTLSQQGRFMAVLDHQQPQQQATQQHSNLLAEFLELFPIEGKNYKEVQHLVTNKILPRSDKYYLFWTCFNECFMKYNQASFTVIPSINEVKKLLDNNNPTRAVEILRLLPLNFTEWEEITRIIQLNLSNYMETFDFSTLTSYEAIYLFLSTFRLPGEASRIGPIIEAWAQYYISSNTDAAKIFEKSDSLYVLAYGIIMLNTDSHNPQIKTKMTLQNWQLNLRGCNNGKNFPDEFLEEVFDFVVRWDLKQ